jgi:hypothetical protein
MIAYRQLKPLLLGLLIFAAAMPAATAAAPDASAATPSPGMARAWFLRPSSSSSAAYGASPMIYANGKPIGTIPENSEFYRDFAPGTYRFTVDPYGSPNHVGDTVQLMQGSQTYLEVQWIPTWEEGYSTGGRHSFFVVNMAPQIAEDWLPSLTFLDQR